MKDSKNKSKSKILTNIKNEARGAAANLNTNYFGRKSGDSWKKHQHATAQLNRVIAKAKKYLPQHELMDFESWVEELIQLKSNHFKIGTKASLLGALPKDISQENLGPSLFFALESLNRSKDEIVGFLLLVELLEDCILKQKWSLAIHRLDEIENEFGVSYWSIETRIALNQNQGKGDENKELIKKLAIESPGLNNFFFYHFGIRNEPAQTTKRFKSLVYRRIDDSALSYSYKLYAIYRMTNEFPDNPNCFSAILGYEQLTTRIDLLFTSLKISTYIVANYTLYSDEEIKNAKEIIRCFGIYTHKHIYSFDKGDAVLQVPVALVDIIKKSIINVFENKKLDNKIDPEAVYINGLKASISYGENEPDEDEFKKYRINFGWISFVLVFNSYIDLPKIAEIFSGSTNKSFLETNENLLNVFQRELHFYIVNSTKSDISLLSKFYKTNEIPFPLIENKIAIWELQPISDVVIDCMIIESANRALEYGEYRESIAISALGSIRNPRIVQSLPFDQFFLNKPWSSVYSYGISIELCVCIHNYLLTHDERQIRTYKRFAVEELISIYNVNNIIDLCKVILNSEAHKTIVEQFIYYVCDLSTLELLPGIDASKDALQARASILLLSSEFNKGSSERLIDEAESIQSQVQVNSVIDVLDESLVYVDEDRLLVACNKEFSTDFLRYKQLISEIGDRAISLEELLVNLGKQTATSFSIPKNEPDDLLYQMLIGFLDMFLNHPVHGLDAVIGRRIRHGTISDELRGTLEHMQLMGQRPRTGADYDLPTKLVAYMAQYEPRIKNQITKSFNRFFQSIDNLIIHLRDEVFQCKKRGKLKPAFEINISPVMFAIASNSAKDAENIQILSSDWFQIFWFSLSQQVESERPFVTEFIKKNVADAFDKLQQEMHGLAIDDATFFASLQLASEELQRRSVIIGNWIRIPRVNYEGITYPLKLVFDAAIALVEAQRPGFDPDCNSDIEQDVELDVHSFPIVHDALKIALVNIAEHSGVKKSTKIFVKISLDKDREKLCFEIVSDIARDGWTKDKASKLESIRDDISKRSFSDRALKPKGSGLSKLATIVHQQESCDLQFGTIENNKMFRLYFELQYIPREDLTEISNAKTDGKHESLSYA